MLILGVASVLGGALASVDAQSLRGSRRSLDRQNEVAHQHDFTYLETPAQVRRFVQAGYLVPVPKSRHYRLNNLSFPYTRPQVVTFIDRLGGQYRAACGQQLVVTSLTRPKSRQPRNASPRSVHPTGMALDLRRSKDARCRGWLEKVLVDLERAGVLEASYEHRPPHYHVALFPTQYAEYVEARLAMSETDASEYRVRRGDSLWEIARTHDTTVQRLRSANDLRGSRIYAGQVLTVPRSR